jgi:hypothetical protein
MIHALAMLAVAALVLGVPAAARAQTGWFITPSLSVAEEYDDNVFVSTTNKQWDFITRFTPGVQVGYRSEPFTLLATSSVDSEIYARNSELDDVAVRKRATLDVKYLPFHLLTLGLDVSYFTTQTPSELVPTTGLQLGRAKATEFNATPWVGYQLTALDYAFASYSYIHDTFEGGTSNTIHRVKLGYTRQVTARDAVSVNYRLHVFENEGSPTTITNTPTLAWTRQLTPNTVLTLEGGPRFVDDGSVEPEAHGHIEHFFKYAKIGVDFVRSEAVVVGRPGKVELQNVTGLLEFEPLKLLKVRFEPGYYKTFGGVDPTARVYGFLLSAFYPIQSWLTGRLNYRFAYQDQAGTTLPHNIVTLSLDASYPIRLFP